MKHGHVMALYCSLLITTLCNGVVSIERISSTKVGNGVSTMSLGFFTSCLRSELVIAIDERPLILEFLAYTSSGWRSRP